VNRVRAVVEVEGESDSSTLSYPLGTAEPLTGQLEDQFVIVPSAVKARNKGPSSPWDYAKIKDVMAVVVHQDVVVAPSPTEGVAYDLELVAATGGYNHQPLAKVLSSRAVSVDPFSSYQRRGM